ncbi:gasdermin-D [Tachyglossus aculeatus]|uniref:gasdermin-D n=1 Tax=Tachyglossus aculeatus TaxID=9261 RepID=UPI0018F76822|nr:gasdermin-D [Tachyglossus aculeatus]
MFAQLTKKVAKKINAEGELLPLLSMNNSKRFRPLCLVRRKRKGTLFFGPRFRPTNLSLLDVLDSDLPAPELKREDKFSLQDIVDGRFRAEVDLPDSLLSVKVSGEIKRVQKYSLEVQIVLISSEDLKRMQDERKLKKNEPEELKELRSLGENLYVVTEVVETLEEARLSSESKAEGSCFLKLLSIHMKALCNHEEVVNIGKGCILAFRLGHLIFRDNWKILHTPTKEKTFPSEVLEKGDPFVKDMAIAKDARGFEDLQREVNEEKQHLKYLDRQLKETILQAVQDLLGHREEMQKVEDVLEDAMDGKGTQRLEGPGNIFLTTLEENSGQVMPELTGTVLYLLGALLVLSDTQQQLLKLILEKGLLPQQLKLVKSILEQTFPMSQGGHFFLTLGPEDEEQSFTLALLEQYGLELPGPNSSFLWKPDALASLSALYGALSLLDRRN